MNDEIKRITKETEYPEEKIIRNACISFDGKQFLVRIPAKISEHFKFDKSKKINAKFTVDVPSAKQTKRKIMVLEVEA